jgi:hypothetical protein
MSPDRRASGTRGGRRQLSVGGQEVARAAESAARAVGVGFGRKRDARRQQALDQRDAANADLVLAHPGRDRAEILGNRAARATVRRHAPRVAV